MLLFSSFPNEACVGLQIFMQGNDMSFGYPNHF